MPSSFSFPLHICIFVLNNFGCNLPVGGKSNSLNNNLHFLVYFFPSRSVTRVTESRAPEGKSFFKNCENIVYFKNNLGHVRQLPAVPGLLSFSDKST
ncbi:hypothetical protein FKM82_022916 [Ascaphus truei]